MALKWDHRYEIGHDRIDAEHKIFLGLIADFQQASSQEHSRERLIRILNEVEKYADFHFVSEENIMIDVAYPEKEHHAMLHRDLLTRLKDQSNQFRIGHVDAEEVFEFLFQWFAIHTSNEDKKLVSYIQK